MRKILSILAALTFVILLVSCTTTTDRTEDPLDLWTDGFESKIALVNFVEAAVDKNNPGYIPVERRVAVFDMDGTLLSETIPDYIDHFILRARVLDDLEYSSKASDFEKEIVDKILVLSKTSSPVGGLDADHGRALASAFKGMTPDEFISFVQSIKSLPVEGYEGLVRGNTFFLPMVQLVNYLQENRFTVYIVSGTDRFICRALVYGSALDIPFSQVIGSDVLLVSNNQGKIDGLDYTFTSSDEVVLGGEMVKKNLKMNKVTAIVREIGVQPVLSFGNSSGDAAMANYTIIDNEYPSLAFMLCCDDTVRENGNKAKADNMLSLCAQNGWIPISMKNDWTTIYGEGVTRVVYK
ncbi:MAG: haloacid dehalogenase-like hydrolase [Sphaerochaetaceae bacterium]|nr:haloacid dehalogenase-like hydrolase [Sphaerochaetaceae bacterium]